MARYSGRYYRGASRDMKAGRRAQAEQRRLDKGGQLAPGPQLVTNDGAAELVRLLRGSTDGKT